MSFVALLGRICFSVVFILASFGHFSKETIAFAEAAGVPMANILVPLSGVLALVGGLSILLGYKARIGAWLIVLFLIPVTLHMHRFWGIDDPAVAMLEQIMFLKNLSMLGGALLIAYFGAGPLSIDNRHSH